ncbi:MAG: hypothetical protein IKC89_01925 [Lentisphaeria bacterium]|nr:hypothetical protein [Lentisphaeria bacterium]
MLSKKHIFSVTAVVAVAVRIVFYALFAGTMFRYYHNVSGLDMQTLLRFSEWSKDGIFPPFFTLHRVLIYLIWKLNGCVHSVDLIFLVQSVTGIFGALALADTVLMLSGNRKAALGAGILSALYLPFMIYEFSVLQESLCVNILIFAVWALLKCRSRRCSWGIALACGIFWGLALTGRPVALPAALAAAAGVLLYAKKKHYLKRTLPLFAGAVLILLGAALFNCLNNGRFSPFYNVIPYTVEFNTGQRLEPATSGKTQLLMNTAANMVKRTPLLFSIRELPENQNLYFWREKMPECRLLPGPEILLSLTVFALIVILLTGKWKKKEGLILWIILLMAVPLCGRDPIGRYRLLLCPAFIVISTLGITAIKSVSKRSLRRITVAVAVLATAVAVIYESCRDRGLRTADFHAWAQATESVCGSNDLATLDAYYDCWKQSFFQNDLAFCSMAAAAMRAQRYDVALQVIKEAKLAGVVNRSKIAYFEGLYFVAHQDPVNVLRAFAPIRPEDLPPELRQFYIKVKFDAENFIKNRKNQLNKTR